MKCLCLKQNKTRNRVYLKIIILEKGRGRAVNVVVIVPMQCVCDTWFLSFHLPQEPESFLQLSFQLLTNDCQMWNLCSALSPQQTCSDGIFDSPLPISSPFHICQGHTGNTSLHESLKFTQAPSLLPPPCSRLQTDKVFLRDNRLKSIMTLHKSPEFLRLWCFNYLHRGNTASFIYFTFF